MRWRACSFDVAFPRPALVMGIVNVTPDSFSDGGRFADTESAVAWALELASQGADIIDIGGESTRPNAPPVSEAEELRRVIPVIEHVSKRTPVPISIDTMKPGVARRAVQAGASLINDVGAARQDPAMWRLAAETGAGYVCMHMQGTPQTMQLNPTYVDVVREVEEFFIERLRAIGSCGVTPEQVIIDPGIGFGKSREHNLQLLRELDRFAKLGRPLLIGVSRKSFMGTLPGATAPGERLPAGLACACLAVAAGANLVRTHDVAPTVQALRMTEAILARKTG